MVGSIQGLVQAEGSLALAGAQQVLGMGLQSMLKLSASADLTSSAL